MTGVNEKRILASWEKNAAAWKKAIDQQEIESRRLVTDQAILDAILSVPAKTILDIGCGEGWLVRKLSALGFVATGIDAVESLINIARALGAGRFHVVDYENMSTATIGETYDIAVCNFSLLGRESVEHVFRITPSLLNDGGSLILQTLHPMSSCGELPYTDGWREGSWAGFSSEFSDPAPWYFRTLASWFTLFSDNGFMLDGITEPVNPATGKAASLIITGHITR